MRVPEAIEAHHGQKIMYGRYVVVKATEGRCCVLEAVKNEEGEA
jgi:hypothetical protein